MDDVDWIILSHCDGHVVKELVEYNNRPAETAVNRIKSTRRYENLLKNNPIWRNCHNFLKKSYESISDRFKIVHDNYGGYRMLYCGNNALPSKTVLTDGPKGYLARIKDDATNLSVIQKSSDRSKSYLMLGPIRFLNSDCEPNCEYDFSSQDTYLVRLRTFKKISPNSELLVKYGSEFFEEAECACNTCDSRKIFLKPASEEASTSSSKMIKPVSNTGKTASFDRSDAELCCQNTYQSAKTDVAHLNEGVDLYSQAVDKENFLESHANEPRNPRKRLRDRHSVRLRKYKAIMSETMIRKLSRQSESKIGNTVETLSSSCMEHDQSSDEENAVRLFTGNCSKNVDVNIPEIFQGPWMSSPLPGSVELIPTDISSIWYQCSAGDENLPTTFLKEPLFPGARVSQHNAQLLIRSFTSQHRLSDACQVDLMKLLNAFVPAPNLLPSAYKLLKSVKDNLESSTSNTIDHENGRTCVLKVTELLKQIVCRNIRSLLRYNIERAKNDLPDYPFGKITMPSSKDSLPIDLILSTDGANFVQSSSNHQMYPIWLQIIQLPPILRMSKKNIALAALWIGRGRPSWGQIVPYLNRELAKVEAVELPNGKCIFLKFKVHLLVADMIAKPAALNMYQHNGFYGCMYCTHPGFTIESSHCYYPEQTEVDGKKVFFTYKTREKQVTDVLVRKAEDLIRQGEKDFNVVGVKGRSDFGCLIDSKLFFIFLNFFWARLLFFLQKFFCYHVLFRLIVPFNYPVGSF